ncbi:helix-turn-helix domain-containing protein [Microbispora triticiradicis]|uniref:winged helix-turn-helix transcriptional regulator n=1 Tax=Microbispora triticiradicis TaxID=2200763 RepID=UPI0027DC8CC7|nr:helix-turn-helix domain-containing protein [Microbispora triticiradicis]MBO4272931.1 transcriptional regulator [Microbispora triticiradicis]
MSTSRTPGATSRLPAPPTWTSLRTPACRTVLLTLYRRRHRFSELREAIGGVTPKVLTQTLRTMERDGLVTREVFAEAPPRVEYAITPLGVSLHDHVSTLADWAEKHVGEILGARAAHDTQAG